MDTKFKSWIEKLSAHTKRQFLSRIAMEPSLIAYQLRRETFSINNSINVEKIVEQLGIEDKIDRKDLCSICRECPYTKK